MKLTHVHITNFRSVEDSGRFSVEHSTCLVGKNEAGKTAVLQALAGLNPHSATPFDYDLERDYPKRFLARYKDRHPDHEAQVIATEWEINTETREKWVSEFGVEAVTNGTVTVSRTYNSSGPQWRLPFNEEKAIQHLIANANLSAPEKSQLGGQATCRALVAKLKELAPSNEKHKALLDKVCAYPNSSVLLRARAICEPFFPRFMYFSTYDRMNAMVHLPTLKKQSDDKSLFSNKDLQNDRLF